MSANQIPTVWELQARAEERGYWLRIQSPFFLEEPWFAGFQKHGATGVNGRPEFEVGDASPERAVEKAYALLVASLPDEELCDG